MEFEKPATFILQTAEREGATMIVMGTRGLGKIKRAILSSVSKDVVNNSPIPVLIVRPKKSD